MTRRLTAIVLGLSLAHAGVEPVFAQSNQETESAKAAKVREGIKKLGVGKKSVVRLTFAMARSFRAISAT